MALGRVLAVLLLPCACGRVGFQDVGAACAGDADCADGQTCNGVERCMPGAVGSDERGCQPGMALACGAGRSCDESAAGCRTDCAGGADADGDLYAAAECGGPDCDDGSAAVNQGATETCNLVDDDCDGATDEAPATCAVSTVGVGDAHACAITAGGDLLCWGTNAVGALGDGVADHGLRCASPPIDCSLVPVAASLPGPAVDVAGGERHTCAVLASGEAWCWGANTVGQLGDATFTDRAVPAPVVGVVGATALVAGFRFTCAVVGGEVWCWGSNTVGQLGDGSRTDREVAVTVMGLSNVTALAAGDDHACAIQATGAVWCWGGNAKGQLGDGTITSSSIPVPLTAFSDAVSIGAGSRDTCAARATGAVWCWGQNGEGQLGNGTTEDAPPGPVLSLEDAVSVDCGGIHCCAVRATGAAVCWGGRAQGQLGDGLTTPLESPVPVGVVGLADAERIAGGTLFTCAARTAGGVVCFGNGGRGQLGDGTGLSSAVPVDVVGL